MQENRDAETIRDKLEAQGISGFWGIGDSLLHKIAYHLNNEEVFLSAINVLRTPSSGALVLTTERIVFIPYEYGDVECFSFQNVLEVYLYGIIKKTICLSYIETSGTIESSETSANIYKFSSFHRQHAQQFTELLNKAISGEDLSLKQSPKLKDISTPKNQYKLEVIFWIYATITACTGIYALGMSLIFTALVLFAVPIYTYYVLKQHEKISDMLELETRKRARYEERFSEVIDADEELEDVLSEKGEIEHDIQELKADYKDKKEIFDQLARELAIYDEESELLELGFYKPHFDFDTSEKYKNQINLVRAKQKTMLSDKTAIYCSTEWTLEGSKAKGRTMTNRAIKLTARAFNNECDVAIANVTWKNITRMEERITKAYTAISKLNESNAIHIDHDYLDLKIEELRLNHEYREKKQAEKEEQAEIRRQMREEAKLEQEALAAQKEEDKYAKLLVKAQKNAEKAAGAKLEKLQKEMADLEQELKTAHERNERAKSMAEQTKAGHVYVISNIGAFGEHVYKIGMTRRLEPFDRVKELGDASVPFIFDVHAMIYAEDAPALETTLHKVFDSQRVNLINTRKEFFNVTLEDIQNEVLQIEPEAEFIETIEAREYRETKALREKQAEAQHKKRVKKNLPDEI